MDQITCVECGKLNSGDVERCNDCGARLIVIGENESGKVSTSEHIVMNRLKSEIVIQLFPLVFGIVTTLLFRSYVSNVLYHDEFIYKLILPKGGVFEEIVPAAIIFLFFWTIGDLTVKYIIVRRQYQSLAHPAIQGSPRRVRNSEINVAIVDLQEVKAKVGSGFVFRAVLALLKHLKATNDSQKSHDYFRHQSDLDSDDALSSYTIVRVFIWAMPTLGFIGTVLGISFAVGDFSNFLSGNIDDIESVKKELSKVSTGLAFAFNTTLLGLVSSLIAMLLTAYVQRKNERLLKGVEELCLGIIAEMQHGQLQDMTNLDINELVNAMHTFTDMVKTKSEQLGEHFDGFNVGFKEVGNGIIMSYSGLGSTMENQVSIFSDQIKELTSKLTSELLVASTAFANTSAALSNDLARLPLNLKQMQELISEGIERTNQSSKQLEKIHQSSTQQLVDSQEVLQNFAVVVKAESEQLGDHFKGFNADFKDIGNGIIKSYSGLGSTMEDQVGIFDVQMNELTLQLTSELSVASTTFSNSSAELSNVIARLPSNLEDVRDVIAEGLERVTHSSMQLEEIFQSSTQQFVDSQNNLTDKVDGIRPTHELITQVTQTLRSCNDTLGQMREAHEILVPLLQELKGPMEFKMVPVQIEIANGEKK